MKLINRKLLAGILTVFGVGVLVAVFIPIASYLSLSKQKFPELISPLYDYEHYAGETDLTKASNWFVGTQEVKFEESKINYYTISIPELTIADATVAIGGNDLKKSLVQFPGTALPGRKGNVVVFGHSVLPSFFNPKDYLTIFSTLATLDKGDDVYIEYDGIKYKYVVDAMFEVQPTDIQILEQHPSEGNLTLVTCTPPGDPRKPRRLIVRAHLVPLS